MDVANVDLVFMEYAINDGYTVNRGAGEASSLGEASSRQNDGSQTKHSESERRSHVSAADAVGSSAHRRAQDTSVDTQHARAFERLVRKLLVLPQSPAVVLVQVLAQAVRPNRGPFYWTVEDHYAVLAQVCVCCASRSGRGTWPRSCCMLARRTCTQCMTPTQKLTKDGNVTSRCTHA